MQAIEYLDDRRLHMALSIANERLVTPFVNMQPTFSAEKTPAATYTGIDPICARLGYAMGSATDVNKALKEARASLTAMMMEDPLQRDEGPNRLPKIRREHSVLKIVPSKIFDNITRFDLWCGGWMGGADKMRKSVIAAIGWGLFGRELSEATLPNALREPSPLRLLLHVARDLLVLRKQPPAWWDRPGATLFDLEVPELAPAPPREPVEPKPLPVTPQKRTRRGKKNNQPTPQNMDNEKDALSDRPEPEDDLASRTDAVTAASKLKGKASVKGKGSFVSPYYLRCSFTNQRRSTPFLKARLLTRNRGEPNWIRPRPSRAQAGTPPDGI